MLGIAATTVPQKLNPSPVPTLCTWLGKFWVAHQIYLRGASTEFWLPIWSINAPVINAKDFERVEEVEDVYRISTTKPFTSVGSLLLLVFINRSLRIKFITTALSPGSNEILTVVYWLRKLHLAPGESCV